ncbi:hypothetical protein SAMN04488072_106178 [Lentibacillus halodurans]|uniref:Uncharacterized protein n=1 Tax=Lentibacillus halodurans TaxID=237679 RepID=A0A1I0Y3U1_9BACI|nr:hypothetical protein [Lentibacillus halodurans]SFB06893.1 hypothetical protein SAMN04488072_106178 [Lentibacillus halodurans]
MTTESAELRLEMVNGHDPHADIPVFVERDPDRNNTIDALYYQPPLIVEGRDMSDKIKLNPLNVKLSSRIVTIDAPVPSVIELSMFKREFPISQFTGEEGEQWMKKHIQAVNVSYT